MTPPLCLARGRFKGNTLSNQLSLCEMPISTYLGTYLRYILEISLKPVILNQSGLKPVYTVFIKLLEKASSSMVLSQSLRNHVS